MPAPRTYMDYNATAPLRPCVRESMVAALAVCGNPSSVHADGRASKAIVESARGSVARLVDARPEDVIFTSGGTEANAMLLARWDGPVAVAASEHDAIRLARPDATVLPVDHEGVVQTEALSNLSAGTLVSVMAANNETGVVSPLSEIGQVVAETGLVWHCDAVQAFGRGCESPLRHGAHAVTLSAHKLGGPKGVGALILATGFDGATPLLCGGGQERNRRAGTENVAAIAGFGAAAEEILSEAPNIAEMCTLRDWIESRLTTISAEAVFAGREGERLPNTTCVAIPGVDAQTLLIAFDLAGISLSAGAACSSGKVAPSHVLTAMGWPEDLSRSAVRISIGRETTRADCERLVSAWETIVPPLVARQQTGLAA